MKAIIPNFNANSKSPLYVQLYSHIKSAISNGEIVPMEKLPSLRNLSSSLMISISTVERAYAQLEVEGYIWTKPNSGYFVSEDLAPRAMRSLSDQLTPSRRYMSSNSNMKYDLSSFDFVKWKKSLSYILNMEASSLLTEGDPLGEMQLRFQICDYLYRSRGVNVAPEHVAIAAGTQQITALLSSILSAMNIGHISLEKPGYLPVQNTFKERHFVCRHIPVYRDGIEIEKLPMNLPSAVYLSPSNQFPTGAVMPIGKRYQLMEWATKNDSYIIEDDYNSELRYFGRPIPPIKSMDEDNRVVYLGSFSSTLFPAVKISYMVLPPNMAKIFADMSSIYSQTCSKTEQLALAHFMSLGHYESGIKKLRRLYSQKLVIIKDIIQRKPNISWEESSSGMSVMLTIDSKNSENEKNTPDQLCQMALNLGIVAKPAYLTTGAEKMNSIILYYSSIPMEELQSSLETLFEQWS